jgi:hypothetical protein
MRSKLKRSIPFAHILYVLYYLVTRLLCFRNKTINACLICNRIWMQLNGRVILFHIDIDVRIYI